MFASKRCHGSARSWCATQASRHTEKYASPCSPIVLLGCRISGNVLMSAIATKNATTIAKRHRIHSTVTRHLSDQACTPSNSLRKGGRLYGIESYGGDSEERPPRVEERGGEALQH